MLAAELTETTRLYARCAASIDPEWIEEVAGDRVDKTYFDPRWDAARGEVVGAERVALYGLTLVARRRISFGAVDPAAAREVFLREALAAGELNASTNSVETQLGEPRFSSTTANWSTDIAELEHKARRQDVLVDDESIYAFYAARIPADVYSAASFERWRARCGAGQPALVVHDARGPDAPRRRGCDRGAVSRAPRDGGRPAAAQIPLRAGTSARWADADASRLRFSIRSIRHGCPGWCRE